MKPNLYFESYISLDVPEPLNSKIYAIRDSFSDKKMSVMPVDIPIIGHFDGNMTLVRELETVVKAVDKGLACWKAENGEELVLESQGFQVSDEGYLVMVFSANSGLLALRECILTQLEGAGSSALKHLVDQERGRAFQPQIYVILKSHKDRQSLVDLSNEVFEASFAPMHVTLYHKEAVPLTRVCSWAI